ncbi:hypothetical protein [Olleya sp. R77988]|uniref:hypothetical protein n=1 Tax=Olleya sp. R77988 TaxID=3093875 RepID=UPI0037CBFB09
MNNLLKLSAFLCLIFIASSCTVEPIEDFTSTNEKSINNSAAATTQACSNQDPQSKLVNNGTVSYTFKIVDSSGTLIEENNIAPGAESAWLSFVDGETTFSVESNTTGISDSKLLLNMATCSEVEIIVNSSNTIDTPTIQELN